MRTDPRSFCIFCNFPGGFVSQGRSKLDHELLVEDLAAYANGINEGDEEALEREGAHDQKDPGEELGVAVSLNVFHASFFLVT